MSILDDDNKELISFIRKNIPEPEFRMTGFKAHVEMSVLKGEKNRSLSHQPFKLVGFSRHKTAEEIQVSEGYPEAEVLTT